MIRQMAILAGGLATRLGALGTDRPKALMSVCGRPFIDHQLRLVHSQGIERVLMCVGRHAAMIEEHVGDGNAFGLQVSYSFDGPVPQGTGGALREASSQLDDVFFVEYGDTYLRAPVAALSQAFLTSGRSALMTLYQNDDRLERSNVQFESGEVRAYDKTGATPGMRHIDFGLLAFRKAALGILPARGPCDLAQLLQELLRGGELTGVEVPERFYEIGTPASLAATEDLLHTLLPITPAARG